MAIIKSIFVFLTIVAAGTISGGLAGAENEPPLEGDVLPEIALQAPQNPLHREYLGLKTGGTFKIPQIKADILIIEIFSMYCPHCQREAPTVNNFYQKIQNDVNLKDKVKMIGIGIGNSDFEINFFRKKYNIPFPLFSDSDFIIHKKIGEVRTPYFIGIKITTAQNHHVFYSQLGGPKDSRQFLEKMLQTADVK
ncbi:peroxiredoxin family protein [Thermodesulfobacteriota bacterium]